MALKSPCSGVSFAMAAIHEHEANDHPALVTSSYPRRTCTSSLHFRSLLHAATYLATFSLNPALAAHLQEVSSAGLSGLGRLGLERAHATPTQALPIRANLSRQSLTVKSPMQPVVPTARQEFTMNCLDGPSRIHACMFEGLLYDTHTQSFYFPGLGEAPSSALSQQQQGGSKERPGDAVVVDVTEAVKSAGDTGVAPVVEESGFNAIDGAANQGLREDEQQRSSFSGDTASGDSSKSHIDFLQAVTPSSNFHMGGLIKPPAEDTCIVTDKIHLRNPFQASSFGHFLRDNLQALVEISTKLGVDPADFRWVSWPDAELDKLPHVVIKYKDWMGGKEMRQWEQLLQECAQSNGGTPQRYLKMEHVIASGAGSDWTGGGTEGEPACNSAHFQPLRALAYRRYSIPHVPVHKQSVPLVTILAAVEGEKRAIANVEQLVKTVQAQMPGVHVEVHGMMRKSPEEQMHVLARTSVLVTNIGSTSFRQIYLPDGAQVILIGALEAPFTGTDGATYTIPGSFREVSRCWGGVSYWDTIPYHVRTEVEITRHDGRTGSVHTQGDKYWEVLRVWDADITIDPDRFMKLLRMAIARVTPPPISSAHSLSPTPLKTQDNSNPELRLLVH